MGATQSVIELAPTNPNGLRLASPLIVAPGCAGALRSIDTGQIGAITTDIAIISTPRAGPRRWGTVPAGIVIERLPSVRFDALVRAERRRWSRSPVPLLLALRGTTDELIEIAIRLEIVEGVAGLVLLIRDPVLEETVTAVRSVTTLPLLPVLPHGPQLAELAAVVVAAGADALVLCGYPTATTQAVDELDLVTGLLVGPTLAPWTLRALQQVRGAVDVPLVAWGGVADAVIARQCLAAGASAVMIDGALYGDPFAVQSIAAVVGA